MIRIMTSNIWGDYFGNPVEERLPGIRDTALRYAPDVLGVQEITPGWYESRLFPDLAGEYTLVEGDTLNYTPLLFRTARFDLLARGWELYTETSDKSKGITWAVLREKETQRCVGVCNTHFWWMNGEEHERIRVKNALQLSARMEAIRAHYSIPVFAFGDLNCRLGSDALETLKKRGILTSYELTADFSPVSSHHGDPKRGEDGLYHGSRTGDDYRRSIDHVVGFSDQKLLRQVVVEDQDVLDATDHSPVHVDFEL